MSLIPSVHKILGCLLAAAALAGCATSAPPVHGRGARPGDRVHLITGRGTIVIALAANESPQNAANFADLVAFGFYDGLRFHELADGDFLKGGCPRGDGLGGPGYMVPDEFSPALKFDRPGIVAMANDGPNTNGSQFFITFRPLPEYDGRYTIIGAVVEGMPIVAQLRPGDRVEHGWIAGP